MRKTASAFISVASVTNTSSSPSIGLSSRELSQLLDDWYYEGKYSLHLPRTTEFRRHTGSKLLWFLQQQNRSHCETTDLRQFLAYAIAGHTNAGRHWDNARMTKPLRPASLHRY